ncbi:MAG: 16S rRNA (cytidine(1402)-2'-O)-methyltransferase [Armatimonadetes bacterium]|nr:16S rRNA (cytidine(1402)-2'-O)-methyltransferase [Armatimonadota bacterium]
MENKGILYLCATPIGNLEDITLRTLRILKEADYIICEDTRQILKLLNYYQIKKKLITYYRHNFEKVKEKILNLLEEGNKIALVSDAGTPCFSDPGEELVRTAYEKKIKVIPVPGACAAVTALSASGLPSNKFIFEGFLPAGNSQRKLILNNLKKENRTIIFYLPPHDLVKILKEIYQILGERHICLAKELTKFFEEIKIGYISGFIEEYQKQKEALKGEYTLIIAPSTSKIKEEPKILEVIKKSHTKKDFIKNLSSEFKISKKEIYKFFLKWEK